MISQRGIFGILAVLVITVGDPGPATFVVLGGLMAVLLLNYLWLRASRVRATISARPAVVEEGRPFELEVVLTNPTRWTIPRAIALIGLHGFVVDSLPEGAALVRSVSLPPGTARRWTYQAISTERGAWPLDLVIEVVDWINMLPPTKGTVMPQVLRVSPRPIRVPPDDPAVGIPWPAHPATVSIVRDRLAFRSLREATPFDDWRDVDWRATARLGTLVVREFEPAVLRAYTLVLDLQEARDPAQISVWCRELLGLLHELSFRGDQVSVVVNGQDSHGDNLWVFEPPHPPYWTGAVARLLAEVRRPARQLSLHHALLRLPTTSESVVWRVWGRGPIQMCVEAWRDAAQF